MSKSIQREQRVARQLETRAISHTRFMRHPAFRRGFTEYRAGLPPDFDTVGQEVLQYEIGRQFSVVCPRNVSLLLSSGKLNSAASELFQSFARSVSW
jgi:hypothetical protein